MWNRWIGPTAAIAIFAGIVAILVLNIEPGRARSPERRIGPRAATPPPPVDSTAAPGPGGAREYPIGEPVERNAIRIAAVWLAAAPVEGLTGPMGGDVIHLEADVHATESNPNGFAKDEFVPYLKITYAIEPAGGKGETRGGILSPMVARDGLHYGANVVMPLAGKYRLTYHVEPPSIGGLGRHSDQATGVDPWWRPYDVSYDWDYPGPQGRAPAGDSAGRK